MIEFLTENWKLFSIFGAIFIELILILIFKKKPVVLDKSYFFNLCRWIEEAEETFGKGHGSEKLMYVLNKASQELGDYYDESRVKTAVEWIMSLPSKKEK